MKTYKYPLITLPNNGIFVFGSNTEGRHGMGTALTARTLFGAIYGQAKGLQGKSYAIITKDLTKRVHPSIDEDTILKQINALYNYADDNIHLNFYIAYSGKGSNLNNYTPQQMADMFNYFNIPVNIVFEEEFVKLIKQYNETIY